MDKDRHTISATELSKFMYCPYQWYYERQYGRKELRRLELERNEKLELDDYRNSNFIKGLNYHDNFYKKPMYKRIAAALIICLILMLLVLIIKKGGIL